MSPDWPVIKKVNTIFTYEQIRKTHLEGIDNKGVSVSTPHDSLSLLLLYCFSLSVIFILKSFEASIFLKVK